MSSVLSPFKRIGDTLERMSQRERTLVAILLCSFVVLLLSAGALVIYNGLDDLEERNAAMRQALKDIASKRGAYLQARAKIASLEARIGQTPLQLNGFLEQVAKDTGIEISQNTALTPENIGKKYIQRSVDIRISKVALEPLCKFMRKLETNPGNLVMVTQLSMRARDDKHVDFDVSMIVSTYERAPKKPTQKGKEGTDEDKATANKEPS